jgi:EAL domain-containing protein (putative c-di-GMP-specific phosphodiesterase class I)
VEYPKKDLQTELLSLKASLYDSNTRLPVYSACFDRLKQMAEDRFMGLVLLQISDLERLESVFGFERYEEVLKRAAFHLQDVNNREFDGGLMVSQRGVFDDQFCLFVPFSILSAPALLSLERIAKRLFKVLESDLSSKEMPGLTLHMGFSILHYNPFLRFERLVHRVVEETAGLAQHQQETELVLHELELRQLLARRAITALYQPIVNLDDLTVIGYEALARGPAETPYEWPEALFTFARQSKLNRELDHQCKIAALEGARGMPSGTKLFINTLPTTLDDPDFTAPEAGEMLGRFGLTPGDLVWELTERHAIEDYGAFQSIMKRYVDLGYNVAIDDLGTGYSSIQTITHVRPLYLKIDISLVSDIDTNLLKQELVSSLIVLAGNINAHLIAEGIETQGELEALRGLGIHIGQGYLLGRPSTLFPESAAPPAAGKVSQGG